MNPIMQSWDNCSRSTFQCPRTSLALLILQTFLGFVAGQKLNDHVLTQDKMVSARTNAMSAYSHPVPDSSAEAVN